jgi:hypothetical protein
MVMPISYHYLKRPEMADMSSQHSSHHWTAKPTPTLFLIELQDNGRHYFYNWYNSFGGKVD